MYITNDYSYRSHVAHDLYGYSVSALIKKQYLDGMQIIYNWDEVLSWAFINKRTYQQWCCQGVICGTPSDVKSSHNAAATSL